MSESNPNEAVTAAYDEYLMPIWKELDVPIERADGCILVDFEGNEYLDAFAGISVTNVGHRNEAVVDAAKAQFDEFVHGCSYVHPNKPAADLAERIAEITPGDLQKTFFCNSGTEAVEGAVKLARKYTGSKEVVALEMGFHGRTLGSLSLTGNKSYKKEMGPTLNDVSHAAPPYGYRCSMCEDAECDTSCAADIERVISSHTSGDIAAIVVEPVMGEAGIVVPPKEWLARVQEIAHDHDALLVADEVQAGYGRTGAMFASEHYDVVPDIIPQAKGIANGLPLGAFTASAEVADAFEAGDHLSTFGGNPVACSAALATIDQLEDGIIENAQTEGEWLRSEFDLIEADYDTIGEIRGRGLMWGIEFVDQSETGPQNVAPAPDTALATAVSNHLREESGVIVGVGGFHKNVLRIQPPLTIERDQLRRVLSGLRDALDAVA